MGDARLLNLIPCEWGIREGIFRERLGETSSDYFFILPYQHLQLK